MICRLAVLFLFVSSTYCFSQADITKVLGKAESYYEKNNYEEAAKLYHIVHDNKSQTAIAADELAFKIALCYYNIPDTREKSIPYFESYISTTQTDSFYESHYLLGQLYQERYRFNEALEQFSIFRNFVDKDSITDRQTLSTVISIINRKIENCNYGEIVYSNPREIIVENLGDSINTPYSEYAPVITPDEGIMVFTRRSPESTGGKISPDGDYFEDIYLSKIKEGAVMKQINSDTNRVGFVNLLKAFKLSSPSPLKNINTNGYEGAIQFSYDASKLYVYKKNNVYVSPIINNSWQKPEEIADLKTVLNPNAYEPSVSISMDGNTIYFSSDRSGGFGGLDLYRATKTQEGKWTAPENLGATINTSTDEDSPYIDPNDITLYFSSKGHSSMGGYDVFKAVMDYGSFSSPQNMGYPVNSPGDDIFFMMTPKYNRGYYASDKPGGKGKMDIYRITFADERSTFAEVKGLVLKGDTLVPAKSKVTLYDPETKKLLSSVVSDSISGGYLLLIGHNKKYRMMVETKGFVPYSKQVSVPGQKDYYKYYQEIHHVYLKDKFGNIIGQSITMYSSTPDDSTTKSSFTANEFAYPGNVSEERIVKALSKSKTLQEEFKSSTDKHKFFYSLIEKGEDHLAGLQETDPELYAIIKAEKRQQLFSAADVKFYISEDSLKAIMANDPSLKFNFPKNTSISFFDANKSIEKDAYLRPDFYVLSSKGVEFFEENKSNSLVYSTTVPTARLDMLLNQKDTMHIPSIVLLFEFERNEINEEAKKALRSFAEFLKANNTLSFQVIGHADYKGSDAFNRTLSLKRAKAVIDYLQQQGISAHRFQPHGAGKLQPIASNTKPDGSDNPEGRKLNRRVEFKLLVN